MGEMATIDESGRLTLPKVIRKALHLSPCDKLELDLTGDSVILKPWRPNPSPQKERCVWVYSCGDPLHTEEVRDAIHDIREQRSKAHQFDSE